MATLSSYENLDFYDKRLDLASKDFVLGLSKEFWVKELDFNQSRPEIATLTLKRPSHTSDSDPELLRLAGSDTAIGAIAGADIIFLDTDKDITLYRGDVLDFSGSWVDGNGNSPGNPNDGNHLVVIAETTTLLASTNDNLIGDLDDTTTGGVEGAVPVLPLTCDILDEGTASSYGMVPVWSLQDGGDLEFSGTEAMVRNKIQGLYSAKRIVEREGSINVSGALYTSDPGASLLEKLSEGSRNIYYEIRWAPYQTFTDINGITIKLGSGPGARVGVATIQNFNVTSTRSEFAQVSGAFTIASRPVPYVPLVV